MKTGNVDGGGMMIDTINERLGNEMVIVAILLVLFCSMSFHRIDHLHHSSLRFYESVLIYLDRYKL